MPTGSQRHCEEQSDAAIHGCAGRFEMLEGSVDCRVALLLAMTRNHSANSQRFPSPLPLSQTEEGFLKEPQIFLSIAACKRVPAAP
jgi:hypothetical protein